MKSFARLAAVGCAALSAVDAKTLRWSRDENEQAWRPAQATFALVGLIDIGVSPAPTPAPERPPPALLAKRETTDNTCAYVNGNAVNSLYCGTDSACWFQSTLNVVGCCPDTTTNTASDYCLYFTTCLNSDERSKYTITTNGRTQYCGSSEYPNCVKYTYMDTVLSGFSMWNCGRTSTTMTVYVTPTDAPSSSRRSSSSSRRSSASRSSSVEEEGTTSTNPFPAENTDPVDQDRGNQQSSGGSSTNVGAIAGGVVGGVAGLALIAFAIIFLVRRSRQTQASHPLGGAPPPAAAAGAVAPGYPSPPPPNGPYASPPGSPPAAYPPGQQPQMQQQQQQQQPGPYGFVPYGAAAAAAPGADPRNSIAKPPYSVTNSVYDPYATNGIGASPPHSPSPPQGFAVVNQTPSPPPPGVQNYAVAGYPPQQQQPSPQQPSPQQPYPAQYPAAAAPAAQYPGQRGYTAELPIGRGDGELRELA